MSNSANTVPRPFSKGGAGDLPSGVILAGGGSRRMGQDKALLSVGAQTLLDLVIERVSDQLSCLAIVGGPQSWARDRSVDYAADVVSGGRGPLAGLVAAMDFAGRSGSRTDFVFVTATDMPFLPADLVSRLMEKSAAGLPVIPTCENRLQPLAALWPTGLREQIASGLADNSAASLKDIYGSTGHTEVIFAGETVDPFFNVNTPEDLKTIEQILGVGS